MATVFRRTKRLFHCTRIDWFIVRLNNISTRLNCTQTSNGCYVPNENIVDRYLNVNYCSDRAYQSVTYVTIASRNWKKCSNRAALWMTNISHSRVQSNQTKTNIYIAYTYIIDIRTHPLTVDAMNGKMRSVDYIYRQPLTNNQIRLVWANVYSLSPPYKGSEANWCRQSHLWYMPDFIPPLGNVEHSAKQTLR